MFILVWDTKRKPSIWFQELSIRPQGSCLLPHPGILLSRLPEALTRPANRFNVATSSLVIFRLELRFRESAALATDFCERRAAHPRCAASVGAGGRPPTWIWKLCSSRAKQHVDGKAKSISHHFETMVEIIVCWCLHVCAGESNHSRVS